ncbi:S66 peptidase family protein [Rathayibacter sp. AY2B9]|uniref:S66 family peptidase n=1 Tax=Rathayibacter sp. AY2B9 TaxID=2080572 RepID=UPI000CE85235|nr:S66 peptidase family protein [Rathayibacter sp. AY2B9]PPG28342.1 LD-carboxypeptidase [Rathayibacter sp. AY2B9]
MASITYPAPLRAGGRVEVPAPSTGVPAHLHDRLQDAARRLGSAGYDVRVRPHALLGGLAPASAADRAADLHDAFRSGDAVLPPWGGELAVELLERLDWHALAEARPWFVGWSDVSTLLLPLTTTTGLATIHGANLMDEPWELPVGFHRWTEVAGLEPGAAFTQHAAPRRRSRPWGAWADEPLDRDRAYEEPTRWRSLDGAADAAMSGRLIGGCLETVSLLAGTPYGDVPGFARRYAPEGTVVYLEAAGSDSVSVLRMLTSLRLAGWFEQATGVLIGRTAGASLPELSQEDAVRRALGDLGVPVILDVDTGHQPPQMPLVNGALAEIALSGPTASITQQLVP